MTTVADILRSKGDMAVHGVRPDDTVYHALRLMADRNVGALLVFDGDRSVVGIVSERDYARKVALHERVSRDIPVSDIMSSPVMVVPRTYTAEQCMALMTTNRLRHLPVVEDGELHGLVSIGDLVKSIISEQQFLIQQMELYISGQPA